MSEKPWYSISWWYVLAWIFLFVFTAGGNYFLARFLGHDLPWQTWVIQGSFYATTMTAYFIVTEKRRNRKA